MISRISRWGGIACVDIGGGEMGETREHTRHQAKMLLCSPLPFSEGPEYEHTFGVPEYTMVDDPEYTMVPASDEGLDTMD